MAGPNPIPLGASPVFVSRPTVSLDGIPVVRSFDFTSATPNLNNGVAFYEMAAGEVLLNQWFTAPNPWLAPALGDFGPDITPGFNGFYGSVFVIPDLGAGSSVLFPDADSALIAFVDASAVGILEGVLETSPGANPVLLQLQPGAAGAGSFAPITFETAQQLYFWVSGDGTAGGPVAGEAGDTATMAIMTVMPIETSL